MCEMRRLRRSVLKEKKIYFNSAHRGESSYESDNQAATKTDFMKRNLYLFAGQKSNLHKRMKHVIVCTCPEN